MDSTKGHEFGSTRVQPEAPAPAPRAIPYPHRAAIWRSLQRDLPAHARVDGGACRRLGVPAFTEGTTSVFVDPEPPLEVAAHEAAHLAQHAGLSRDLGLGAERHAQALARRVSRGLPASDLLAPRGASVAGQLHTWTPEGASHPEELPSTDYTSYLADDALYELYYGVGRSRATSYDDTVLDLRRDPGRLRQYPVSEVKAMMATDVLWEKESLNLIHVLLEDSVVRGYHQTIEATFHFRPGILPVLGPLLARDVRGVAEERPPGWVLGGSVATEIAKLRTQPLADVRVAELYRLLVSPDAVRAHWVWRPDGKGDRRTLVKIMRDLGQIETMTIELYTRSPERFAALVKEGSLLRSDLARLGKRGIDVELLADLIGAPESHFLDDYIRVGVGGSLYTLVLRDDEGRVAGYFKPGLDDFYYDALGREVKRCTAFAATGKADSPLLDPTDLIGLVGAVVRGVIKVGVKGASLLFRASASQGAALAIKKGIAALGRRVESVASAFMKAFANNRTLAGSLKSWAEQWTRERISQLVGSVLATADDLATALEVVGVDLGTLPLAFSMAHVGKAAHSAAHAPKITKPAHASHAPEITKPAHASQVTPSGPPSHLPEPAPPAIRQSADPPLGDDALPGHATTEFFPAGTVTEFPEAASHKPPFDPGQYDVRQNYGVVGDPVNAKKKTAGRSRASVMKDAVGERSARVYSGREWDQWIHLLANRLGFQNSADNLAAGAAGPNALHRVPEEGLARAHAAGARVQVRSTAYLQPGTWKMDWMFFEGWINGEQELTGWINFKDDNVTVTEEILRGLGAGK